MDEVEAEGTCVGACILEDGPNASLVGEAWLIA